MDVEARELASTPIHLGGTTAEPMAGFDGSPAWFERYTAEHSDPGFLVSSFIADVDGPATGLFITSGEGTTHRGR